MYQIEVKKESTEKVEVFTFNVLSVFSGLVLFLSDYKLRKEGDRERRWAHFGNDGRFLKRNSIEIPDDVLNEAKAKLAGNIAVQ